MYDNENKYLLRILGTMISVHDEIWLRLFFYLLSNLENIIFVASIDEIVLYKQYFDTFLVIH